MTTDHGIHAIKVPLDVARCPTCGRRVWLEVEEWEELPDGTGIPTDGGVIAHCTRSYHEGAEETRHPYVWWLPIRQKVYHWARENVRVMKDGSLQVLPPPAIGDAPNGPARD